jgi:hypothetical protein
MYGYIFVKQKHHTTPCHLKSIAITVQPQLPIAAVIITRVQPQVRGDGPHHLHKTVVFIANPGIVITIFSHKSKKNNLAPGGFYGKKERQAGT